MRDFKAIMAELKFYLTDKKETKILDKDMANALQMSQSRFATIKRRNSTPYVNILEFCKREDLCCDEIFFD